MSLSTVRLHQLLVAAAFLVPCVVLVGAAWWNRAEVLREEDSAVVRTAAVMHEHASKVFDTAELAMDRVDDYVFDRSWTQISAPATGGFLASLKAPLAQARAVWVVDPQGRIRASSREGDLGASSPSATSSRSTARRISASMSARPCASPTAPPPSWSAGGARPRTGASTG